MLIIRIANPYTFNAQQKKKRVTMELTAMIAGRWRTPMRRTQGLMKMNQRLMKIKHGLKRRIWENLGGENKYAWMNGADGFPIHISHFKHHWMRDKIDFFTSYVGYRKNCAGCMKKIPKEV